MRQVRLNIPDHIYEILSLYAMEEGKKMPAFAREGLMCYARSMGYLTVYDDINKNLRTTKTRI